MARPLVELTKKDAPFVWTKKHTAAVKALKHTLYADTRRRDVTYTPGDLVWVSSRNLPGLNQCSNFEPRFRGPFPINERIGQVAHRVALPPTYTCHSVFHVSQFVPDRPRDPQKTTKEAAVGWLPVTDPDGRPTHYYEVDYILPQRGTGPAAQYLIKWRGVQEDQATWEPASHLTHCPARLRAWRRHHRKAQRAPRVVPAAAAPDALSPEKTASPTPRGGKVERQPPYSRSTCNSTPPV
ncbi:Pol protein, related [Eimeria brunetti]|uniref:Pol protein, related n=1 Tax=Eimeria brunetti TaxID=51314 RepID=U6M1X2_9EIME|nr:Pol protein, related [Eimeria brunetti]